MDSNKLISSVSKFWDDSVIPTLSQFIKIPCKSPPFDPEWKTNKYFEQADELIINWAKSQGIEGIKGEIVHLEGRTPFLFIEIPGSVDSTILFYGHIDKMPETEGWQDGLGAWDPILKNGKLYGRGSSDDGYAGFAPIAAIKALRDQNIPHARCVIIMEATEECGSPDFAAYLNHLKPRIGDPSMVIILDADGENYEQLWCVSSLRGIVSGKLRVEMLESGIHSGTGSGVVASTFRIARQLLSRIEDEKTGKILIPEFWTEIPQHRIEETKAVAPVVGDEIYKNLPFVAGAKPMTDDLVELHLNQAWRPFLGVIGADGMPPVKQAGNVLRPFTELQLSIRIPPKVDPDKLAQILKQALEKDPPYGAKVTFEIAQNAPGWDAPKLEPWLEEAIHDASKTYFGNPAMFKGQGGAIGIVHLLNSTFPNAKFIVSGASGPDSNAHVANESLDIPNAKKVTCCVADIMAKLAKNKS